MAKANIGEERGLYYFIYRSRDREGSNHSQDEESKINAIAQR